MNLLEFDEILKDVDFGQELRVYTDLFLEEAIEHLQDRIDELKAELDWREETEEKQKEEYELKKFKDGAVRQTMKNGGVQCDDPKCVCHEEEKHVE